MSLLDLALPLRKTCVDVSGSLRDKTKGTKNLQRKKQYYPFTTTARFAYQPPPPPLHLNIVVKRVPY